VQERAALGALAVLVGRDPEGFHVGERELETLREPAVTPGLPAELLLRRPDIAAAEFSLRAANADVAAARAALFPALSLTANGGLQNPAVQAAVITLSGTGPSLTVGAALTQAIFDGGRHGALRAEAEARAQELLANYRAAIRAGLLDVETALDLLQQLRSQEHSQRENLVQSEAAYEGARLRYHEGSGDYLTLLDAQRAWVAARAGMSRYRLSRLSALVNLCKALGGGWTSAAVARR